VIAWALVPGMAAAAAQPNNALAPPEFCAEALHQASLEDAYFTANDSAERVTPQITFLDEAAVVVEYPSVYDVHSALDPDRPIRSQGGTFDERRILEDLEAHVNPARYDFVLMYSLQELPGWVHAGGRWNGAPAKNIGQANFNYGNGIPGGNWTRLRGTPHMNQVDLYQDWELFPGSDGATLIPIHEIGHYWMVNWSRNSPGPQYWRPGDPLAYLAGASYHWSWNWVDILEGPEDMPGIMYSAPLSYQFNAFDLYAMGLVTHGELADVAYPVYECAPPNYDLCEPGDVHELNVGHLVQSLELTGPAWFEGDGRRIPASDDSVRQINALIVIVKGADETLDAEQEALIRRIATELPPAWSTATWGESQMFTRVVRRTPLVALNAGLNDAWVHAQAPYQGLLVTVLPQLGAVFVAWFTFDTTPPPPEEEAVFGAPDQRWVTAYGPYQGTHAELTAELTTGGRFNSPQPVPTQTADYGTLTIDFDYCDEARLAFDFPSAGKSGGFTLRRVLDSNVAWCESLATP